MKINQAVATRIRGLLRERGITQYRLALNSGVAHATLNNITQDTVNDNMLSTVILIASGFDMTVSEFLDDPMFLEENLS